MQNSILLYRLFDIGENFNLNKVESTLAKEKPTSRLRLTRVRPKSIVIQNPPVAVDLGEITVTLGQQRMEGYLTAKVYELGDVSLILRLNLQNKLDYDELHKLAVDLYHTDSLEEIFKTNLDYIKKALAGTYNPALREDFMEDFTIYFFRHWDESWNPVPLLLAEREELSQQTIDETLRNSFTYGENDLAILTWDSALVYDKDGSTDIPDLLEFALTQLLELRYYDGLLTDELNNMYDHIDEANTFNWYFRLTRYRNISKNLMSIVAEITEITEKVQNLIKVTEDVFYARVFGAALNIFRTQAWNTSIQRKVSVIQQTYQMLSAEIENSRATFLEAAILFLIAVEIILSLLNVY